jgi:hypothetical protein
MDVGATVDAHRRRERGRGVAVIEQGGIGGESLLTHELLGEELTVVLAHLRVPLLGDPPDGAVVGHDLRPTPDATVSDARDNSSTM